ncbi:hypothetical protein [Dactylosporangium sp. CA-139066]|uniref:hypothetical protein n=1 Tax=Dactylosporangium sp. CA-139066 TaxID=3239930 RepID=UPI003D915984
MHYSQLAADRIAAAQHVIMVHLPSLTGELCSACGHPFPCAFRRAADGTLDAYGRLPRRLPGATLRAAGVLRPTYAVAWGLVDAKGREATSPQPHRDDPQGRDEQGRRRGWFDAAVNPAVGVAQVPNTAHPSRFVPLQRSGS